MSHLNLLKVKCFLFSVRFASGLILIFRAPAVLAVPGRGRGGGAAQEMLGVWLWEELPRSLSHSLHHLASGKDQQRHDLLSCPHLPHLRQRRPQGPRDEVQREANALHEVSHSLPRRGPLCGCGHHPDHQDGHHLSQTLHSGQE